VTHRDETRGDTPCRTHNSAQTDRFNTTHAGSSAHDDADLGRRVIGRLNETVGADRVRRLLGSDDAVRCRDGSIEIRVSDKFSADMVERRLGDEIRRTAAELAPGRDLEIRVRVGNTAHRPAPAPAAPATSTTPKRTDTPRPRPTVPEYIVGAPNRVAFEACRRAACEADGPSLVFIHGACGVGKTHLLRVAASTARRARPDARIRFTSGEQFVSGYVRAIRDGTADAFQRKHRRLDLLVIDDVHVVAGKGGTQQELVRTLSDLQLAGARVILASDAHPRDIAKLHEALGSRFVSGVVAPISRPDEDMVRRLIPALAKRRGLILDPRGHDMLVARVMEDDRATVRDIEGILTQVQAMGNLMDHDRALFLSADHVRRAVEMRAGARPGIRPGPVSIDRIIDTVCAELGVARPDLGGKGRAKKVVLAREIIVHLGKRHTGRSYPELAMDLSRPNHSTVITAHQRFEAKLKNNDPVRVGASFDGCCPGELVGRIERAMGLA